MIFILILRLSSRICLLVGAYLAYLVQLPSLILGRKKFAAKMLSVFCRLLLKSLGIKVCIQSDLTGLGIQMALFTSTIMKIPGCIYHSGLSGACQYYNCWSHLGKCAF